MIRAFATLRNMKRLLVALFMLVSVSSAVLAPVASAQIQQQKNCGSQGTPDSKCVSTLPSVNADGTQLKRGLAVLFGVIAAISIVVVIVGAIGFVTADGNPENISKSKKTVIYALLGLVIALSAEVVVLTLIGRLF